MKKNVQKHFDDLEKKFNRQYQKRLDKEKRNKAKSNGSKLNQPVKQNGSSEEK